MSSNSISKDALKFLKTLNPKQRSQLLLKIVELLNDSTPADSKQLTGEKFKGIYRVDCGEYRIAYTIKNSYLQILVIDVRNDDEIYKQLDRKIK